MENLFYVKKKLIKKWILSFDLKLTDDELIYSNENYGLVEKDILEFFNDQYKLNHFRSVLNTDQIKIFTKIDLRWLKFVLSKMINKNLIISNKGGYSLFDYRFEATKEEKINLPF